MAIKETLSLTGGVRDFIRIIREMYLSDIFPSHISVDRIESQRHTSVQQPRAQFTEYHREYALLARAR